MTIPEEMMAVIQETARKAAREGAKEVIAEQTRKAAGRCDRRLRNTKLLLKNYRMFKKHCTGAVYTDETGDHDGKEEETALELLDMMLPCTRRTANRARMRPISAATASSKRCTLTTRPSPLSSLRRWRA